MKKRRIEIAVISDVHLGTYQCHAEELLAYLSSIRPKKLILNGDIVDRGRTGASYFPQAHYKVLKKIFGMAATGTQVYYLCGSQEAAMRRFRGYNLGDFHVRNRLLLELDGRKAWIFHGDIVDKFPRMCKWLTKFGGPGYGLLLGINRGMNWVRLKHSKTTTSAGSKLHRHPEEPSRGIQRFEKNSFGPRHSQWS